MNKLALNAPLRVLYLSQDPALIRRQLAGETLTREQAGPLRDDVSTDEITPVHILSHYDDTLGDFAHTGLCCDSENPIARRALRQAGFAVLVAGRRYGKGSSREHSPTAEKLAGVQLVIAESFERIYRQNADNIGLFTSTDLGLLDRIARGEALTLADLVQGREALAASVLGAGGLLRWGQRFLSNVDSTAASVFSHPARPQTLFEKILTRHRLTAPHTPVQAQAGNGLFVRADWRFIHEYYTGMADTLLRGALGPDFKLQRPEQIVVFEDHTSYVEESPAHVRGGLIANMHAMSQAQRDFAARHGLRMHRTLTDAEVLRDDGRNVAGISHAMVAEHYALPGQMVVGTDSHTPHSGALGCVAFGVGTTDMADAFVTGAVRVTLPECVRIELQGQMPPGVTAKDLMLHLLATSWIRSGSGVGKVFEFAGDGIVHLSIDERATLTNIARSWADSRASWPPMPKHGASSASGAVWTPSSKTGCTATKVPTTSTAWWWTCPRSAPWWRGLATRVRAWPCRTCKSACASTSPMAARVRRASEKTLTITTRCWPGAWRRG